MAEAESMLDVAYRMQRTEDLRVLRELREDLPVGSIELPGVIRAIEVLTHEPTGVRE